MSNNNFKLLANNKKAYHDYETRKEMLEAIRYVDLVIPENRWEQKRDDVADLQTAIG